ncbi:uncharacterized protein FOBCDRAFT_236158 [Fusarium oxysporum Fo47]|uniref:uncharacterized protein n=1 Tax=Fusarium oxysporum Fo47 TaxID=660027 RepID=UPI002869E5D1|nr:uncharacterized protein FOBCDRAFT_236158 [Fusarium oxysporum Fo47]QKD48498.2 hypothetical protein FOBCDRAFT_236158 [Fusarium oxysporum Fo47]
MHALAPNFVDEVIVPIRVISTGEKIEDEDNTSAEVHQFSTLEQVESHFSRTTHSYNFVSICQRNSYRPLEITEPMFNRLIKKFDLKASAWDVASCFYDKDFDIESTYCAPFTIHHNGNVTEVSYTIRYPEFKSAEGTWVIRQTGIYQKFNTKTLQNLFILFNPAPSTRLHQYAQANNAVATFIEELTETEYHHLTELAFLETRLVQVPAMLAASRDVLEGLVCLCREMTGREDEKITEFSRSTLAVIQQHIRECAGYTRVADCLEQRVQKITQLLANTLSFREQLNAKVQNNSMLKLNNLITTLTVLYLPASFVASFFGMNFFDFDNESRQIVGTPILWIYFLCSAVMTVLTYVFYHLLIQKAVLKRITWKIPSIKMYTRTRTRKKELHKGPELV